MFSLMVNSKHDNTGYWTEICPSCHSKYRNILKNKCSASGSGEAACGVKGCTNTNACWYVDFNPEDVKEL